MNLISRNKTAIITGANRGLGLEIAKLFISNNINVIMGIRDPSSVSIDETIRKHISSGSIAIHQLDLSKENSILNFLNSISNIDIDILVNNAAIYDQDKTTDAIFKTSSASIYNSLQINCIGPFF